VVIAVTLINTIYKLLN